MEKDAPISWKVQRIYSRVCSLEGVIREKKGYVFFPFIFFLLSVYSGTRLFSMFSLLTWPFLLFEPLLKVNYWNFTLKGPPYFLPSNRSASICHLFLLSISSSAPSATKPILKSSSEGRTLNTFALYLGEIYSKFCCEE